MSNSSFYSEEELKEIGLKNVGRNVLISRKCSMYGVREICIGDNVRIDDFTILSGRIILGNYVHIAAGAYLFGGDEGIELKDYCGISSHCSVYATTDDYLGEAMTNPTIPEQYRNVTQEMVVMEKHVVIGAGSIVLPGVYLGEGSAFGSMSLITKSTEPWMVYKGIPAKVWKERKRMLLELENKLRSEKFSGGHNRLIITTSFVKREVA